MFLKIFVQNNNLYVTNSEGDIISVGSAESTVYDIITGFVGSVHTNDKATNVSIATNKGSENPGWYNASIFHKGKQQNNTEKGQFSVHVCKSSPNFVKSDGSEAAQGVSKAGFALPKLGSSGGKVVIPTVKTGKMTAAAADIVIEPMIVPTDF